MSVHHDNQRVPYVGLHEENRTSNSGATMTYLAAPSYDTASYVYPMATPVASLSVQSGECNNQPKRCKGKMCLGKLMIWVGIALLATSLACPHWINGSSTYKSASNPPPSDSNSDAEEGSGAVDTLATVKVTMGLFKTCHTSLDETGAVTRSDCSRTFRCGSNNDHHQDGEHHGDEHHGNEHPEEGERRGNGKKGCKNVKAMAGLTVAALVLTVISLIAGIITIRRNVESRKVWIAPLGLLIAISLMIATVVLASKVRHTAVQMVPHPSNSTVIFSDAQFGSAFYIAIMSLISLFYGFLSFAGYACHVRCARRRCLMAAASNN